MSRRQARLERQSARALKDAEKSARLKEATPAEPKAVRFGADPGSIFRMQMTWTCEDADRTGAWPSGAPRQWTGTEWDGTIHPKLAEFSKLTWAEVDKLTTSTGHKMHHSMPTEVLDKAATDRLSHLGRSEESIFRFRLGGKPRLWGFRAVAEFRVLWHDPQHEVYPVEPD